MHALTASSRTLVLPLEDGRLAAFDPRYRDWALYDGTRVSRSNFGSLTRKFARHCPDLVLLFIGNGGRVRKIDWDRRVRPEGWDLDSSGDPELRSVYSAMTRAIKELKFIGDFADTIYGDGYELIPGHLKEIPPWLRDGRDPAPRAVDAETSLLPAFHWVDELVQLVREQVWTRAQLVHGGGLEQVRKVLEGMKDLHVAQVNLGAFQGPKDLTDRLAILAPRSIATDIEVAGRRRVILARGFGEHVRRYGRDSAQSLAARLQDLEHSPNTTVIVLSTIPTEHVIGVPEQGSLLSGLAVLLPAASDADQMAAWAKRQWATSASEIDTLLDAAKGQIDALLGAFRARSLSQSEQLDAIQAAHHQHGEAVLNGCGTCCWRTLVGVDVRPQCVRVLAACGILAAAGTEVTPRVDGWSTAWRKVAAEI